MSKVKRPSLYHIVVIFLITLACQPVNDQLLQGTQVAEEPGVSIPTVTPTPCVGCSRALPIDAGQVAQTKHWQVQVLETLPGEEAWETLYEANYFNDPPPPRQRVCIILPSSLKYVISVRMMMAWISTALILC